MRVLHISQSNGGVERYLLMLLRYLAKFDVQNILLCSNEFKVDEFSPFSQTIIQIPMVREINLKKDFSAVFAVRHIINEVKPDIVYCHSSKAGVIGRMASIGLKTKVLYNAHGWAFNMKVSKCKQMFYGFVEGLLSILTDKIICISENEKQSALRYNICAERKLTLIYNGVDIEGLEGRIIQNKIHREELKIPNDAFVVGMVGRLSDQKSPKDFIQMARIVKDSVPNSFFLIVGDGPERSDVEKLIFQLGLSDSVLITGWVSNPIDYVNLFDVSVLLSSWEGFGLVLVEYMIAKKAIVATNVDAIPEVVRNGECGLLVNSGDYESAARFVMNLYNDGDLKTKLEESAYNDAKQRFSMSRVAEEHMLVFQDMINM